MAETRWTRRTFVQAVASLAALESVTPAALGLSRQPSARFAFVASAAHAIHAFAVRPSGNWTQTQSLPSNAPAALALSSNRRFLYVANAVDSYEHLPTGSVESYAVDRHTGVLTLLNRQPLALAATMPSHLAVSPNGHHLAVAAGGASVCLLPLEEDGRIGRVTASFRHLGLQGAALRLAFQDDRTLLAYSPGGKHTLTFEVCGDGALGLSTDRKDAAPMPLNASSQLAHPNLWRVDHPVAIALV